MNKTELIAKIKNTTSLVEFYKLKENILENLAPATKSKEKEAN